MLIFYRGGRATTAWKETTRNGEGGLTDEVFVLQAEGSVLSPSKLYHKINKGKRPGLEETETGRFLLPPGQLAYLVSSRLATDPVSITVSIRGYIYDRS